jgi:hypothetical protein
VKLAYVSHLCLSSSSICCVSGLSNTDSVRVGLVLTCSGYTSKDGAGVTDKGAYGRVALNSSLCKCDGTAVGAKHDGLVCSTLDFEQCNQHLYPQATCRLLEHKVCVVCKQLFQDCSAECTRTCMAVF